MKRYILISTSFSILSLLFLATSCGSGSFTTTTTGNGGGTNSNLAVATSSMSAGTVGTAYTATLKATGGTAPYQWSLKSGTLPAGVSLSAAGSVSGTPTAAGTAKSLVFEVTDANKNSATSSDLSLLVNPEVPPAVATSALQNGNVGVAYSATLTATGGTKPYTWSVNGTLPAGLSLNKSTGAITGTPTASGTFASLVFDVTDFYNAVGASQSLSVKIDPAVQVSTTSLPNGTQGSSYSANLTATGGSGVYTWSLQSGSLPAGLSLNASTGAITGTPTTANIFSGLVFQATDADTATGVSSPISFQVYNPAGCSAGAESNLGTQPFTFLVKGFSPGTTYLAPMTTVGTFTPDGQGGISAGEEDINSASGAQSSLAIIPASSSYTLGPDNNGCLVLTTSAGTTNFHFSVSTPSGTNSFTQGHVMVDDSAGTAFRGTGILRLQDPTALAAGLNGMYAFLFTGTDSSSGNFGMAGSFTAAAGNATNLAADADDAGSLLTETTGGTVSASSTDTYGRGIASFTMSSSGTNYTVDTVFYVVSSTEVLFASTDLLSTNAISSGRAFATNSASFTAAYLQNNYVGHATGLAINDAPEAVIMTATFDGISAGTAAVIQDYSGTISKWPATVNYSVDATTGRVSFTGNFVTPVGYLVTGFNGVGAVLLANDYPATAGMLELQTANSTPPAGNYSIGTEEDADYLTVNQVGAFSLGSTSFSGTETFSNPASPFLAENQAVSNSFSIPASGTGTLEGDDAVSTGSVIYFIDEQGGANKHPEVISITK